MLLLWNCFDLISCRGNTGPWFILYVSRHRHEPFGQPVQACARLFAEPGCGPFLGKCCQCLAGVRRASHFQGCDRTRCPHQLLGGQEVVFDPSLGRRRGADRVDLVENRLGAATRFGACARGQMPQPGGGNRRKLVQIVACLFPFCEALGLKALIQTGKGRYLGKSRRARNPFRCGTNWQPVAVCGNVWQGWKLLARQEIAGKAGNCWQGWKLLARQEIAGKAGNCWQGWKLLARLEIAGKAGKKQGVPFPAFPAFPGRTKQASVSRPHSHSGLSWVKRILDDPNRSTLSPRPRRAPSRGSTRVRYRQLPGPRAPEDCRRSWARRGTAPWIRSHAGFSWV